jgi:hypothetical protein
MSCTISEIDIKRFAKHAILGFNLVAFQQGHPAEIVTTRRTSIESAVQPWVCGGAISAAQVCGLTLPDAHRGACEPQLQTHVAPRWLANLNDGYIAPSPTLRPTCPLRQLPMSTAHEPVGAWQAGRPRTITLCRDHASRHAAAARGLRADSGAADSAPPACQARAPRRAPAARRHAAALRASHPYRRAAAAARAGAGGVVGGAASRRRVAR